MSTTSFRPVDETLVSTREAVAQAGVTYRQADYWLRTGIVTIEGPATPGGGNPRRWSGEDITVLRVLGRVSTALHGKADHTILWAAAVATRRLIANDWLGDPAYVDLTGDVQLTVETSA